MDILFQSGGIDLESKLPPISIKAEPLFTVSTPLGDFPFTNSMLFTLVVIGALTLFFAIATRRMRLVPKGAQNFGEALVELLLGISEGTAGKAVGRRIFPLIATLFLFIIVANWSGLLPGVGTIGYCGEHHEVVHEEADSEGLPQVTFCGEGKVFIPFLRAANADINTTLAMALLAVGVVQIAGIAAHGLGGYAKELFTPIMMAPLHIIGELSRVISLSFRLFGNIFGGEVLVTVMYALLGSIFVGFGTAIFLGLELLFGFIQALVFSILTLVYIATAVGGHGSGEHAPAHDAPHGSAEELGQKIAGKLTGREEHAEKEVPATEPKSGTERHMG
ncbi:MAG TPA: F0F1 ATP synthase subunit A [Chloroflexia bacterium]|jgi:F-type H+-transporting ATPase subunit a